MTTDSHVSGSSYETAKKTAPLDQGREKKYQINGEMRTASTVERRTTAPVCFATRLCPISEVVPAQDRFFACAQRRVAVIIPYHRRLVHLKGGGNEKREGRRVGRRTIAVTIT
jgi:hypothetical protein